MWGIREMEQTLTVGYTSDGEDNDCGVYEMEQTLTVGYTSDGADTDCGVYEMEQTLSVGYTRDGADSDFGMRCMLSHSSQRQHCMTSLTRTQQDSIEVEAHSSLE